MAPRNGPVNARPALPFALRWLLHALAPAPDDASSLIADLEDEFGQIAARDGRRAASRWLRWQLVHSIWPLARQRARRMRRDARGILGMTTRGAITDVRLVTRRLAHAPGFAALAVLTLTLGIGANSTIFSLAYAIWLKPLPYAAADRLVTIYDVHRASGTTASVSAPEIQDYRAAASSFASVAGYNYGAQVAKIAGEPVRIVANPASTNLFQVLGVRPVLGRDFEPADAGTPVLMLSYATWSARFGRDPGILNRHLAFATSVYSVVGVMPEGFRFPMFLQSEVWIPTNFATATERDFRYSQAIARLKPGVTLEAANRELGGVADRLAANFPATNSGWTVRAAPLDRRNVSGYRAAFGALLGLVGLFLLIGCANLAGLLVARNAGRRAELAVCRALGASSWRLARQLLIEALALAGAGGAGGVLLSVYGARVLAAFLPSYLPGLADVRVDVTVLAFSIAVSMVTAAACALVPALALRSLDASEAVVGSRRVGPRSHRLQSVLVLAEIAMAMLLLVGAGLMARSFIDLVNRDRGYQPHGVLALNVSLPFDLQRYGEPAVRAAAFDEILLRVSRVPGVTAAGATNGFPGSQLGGLGGTILSAGGGTSDGRVTVGFHTATTRYFEAMGVPLRAGRTFGPSDTSSSARVIIVNESLARELWPDGQAVGRSLTLPNQLAPGMAARRESVEVVGVVGDLQVGSRVSPDVFLPLAQSAAYWIDLVVRTGGDPAALAVPVRRALRDLNPDLLLENSSTLDAIISDGLGLERAQSVLASVVAILGAVVSGVGLYALLAYLVAQRTREIGIRLALGSTRRQLFLWMFGRGALLALAGVVVGSAGTLAAARALQHQVFGLTTVRPIAFVLPALLLLLIAGIAIWAPARRVMRVDPLVALRQD